MEFQSQQAIRGTNAVKYPNDPKPSHTCRIHKVASKLSVSANHQGTAHCTMKSPRKGAEQQHIMGALALLCQVRGPAARVLDPGNPILGFIVISNISKYKKEQDKVNNADSAFIFLIIQSQNQWSGRRRWPCLVLSLLER